jgi:hypothetical protein
MMLVLAFSLPLTDDGDLASHATGWSADSADDAPHTPLATPPALALVAFALVVVGLATTRVRLPRPFLATRHTRLRAPPSLLGS